MPATFGIVDLFSGPGGLGEGFASMGKGGHTPFRIGLSVEKEASAHRTLTLRAFLRHYKAKHGALPSAFINLHAGLITEADWKTVDASSWGLANEEARCLELGTGAATEAIDQAIAAFGRQFDDTILIGGPPCQAYSLVGRARANGKRDYVPERDERHYLFREYIRVLDRLRPAVFVMENVRGMLSSTVDSRLVFEMLMEDLASLGTSNGHRYELRAICSFDGITCLREAMQPSDFVVRAEEFGVPQRRHRVIIIGVRVDLISAFDRTATLMTDGPHTVADALGGLPALRSGISRGLDDPLAWRQEVAAAARRLASICLSTNDSSLCHDFQVIASTIAEEPPLPRVSMDRPEGYGTSHSELLRWIERPELLALAQHETRGHMPSDLERYLYAAAFGRTHGYSPKATNFPPALSPLHRNWRSGIFNDRFRVQLFEEPSTTVTSHISKDGHYFIHPDPMQCRSLTVREAARLQTFPDDYLFLGNRTQQYVQVGNAVPPYLARHIAALIGQALANSATRSNNSLIA